MLSAIRQCLTNDAGGIEPTEDEISRHYRLLVEKYGDHLDGEIVAEELRRSRVRTESREWAMEVIEEYLARQSGRSPTEREETEFFRTLQKRYGDFIGVSALERALSDEEQAHWLREATPGWADRAIQAVRKRCSRLFGRNDKT